MIAEDIRNIKSGKKDLRKFGLSVGAVLFALGCVLFWFGKPSYPYLLAVGLFLVVTGALFPRVLLPLQKVWMTFAVVMGWFMTRVILGVLFYLAFTSTGVVARAFGKHFLGTKKPQESYWNYRKPRAHDRKSYERQY